MKQIEVQIPIFKKNSNVFSIEQGHSRLSLIPTRFSSYVFILTLISCKSKRSVTKYFFFEEEAESYSVDLKGYDSFQLSRTMPGWKCRLKAIFE
jgi:hypothetical protein